MAFCAGCGQRFTPTKSYHRRCWNCFSKQSGGGGQQEFQQGYVQGYEAGVRDTAKLLDGSRLKMVASLCHPDRHPPERREMANRVTGWILEARDHFNRRSGRG